MMTSINIFPKFHCDLSFTHVRQLKYNMQQKIPLCVVQHICHLAHTDGDIYSPPMGLMLVKTKGEQEIS